jgi:hypothetical protein
VSFVRCRLLVLLIDVFTCFMLCCGWLLREYYYLNCVDMPIVVCAVSGELSSQLQHNIKHVNTSIRRTNNLQHQDYQEVLQYKYNEVLL